MVAVKIVHFSDLLCIWGHIGEANVYQLAETFGARVELAIHFCSVFPDTGSKIGKGWAGRGGFDGYAAHVRDVAARFPGHDIHPDTWVKARPLSSASPQLMVKAIALIEAGQAPCSFAERPSVRAATALRRAFFTEGRDIANWAEQRQVCREIGLAFEEVTARIETGEAIASLAADYELAHAQAVQGSPTYILNEGRQKLFGNIGFGILSANVGELLTDEDENASA